MATAAAIEQGLVTITFIVTLGMLKIARGAAPEVTDAHPPV
jgi:ribose/xylose/arabinose/galactoside ABC-type transport system permease subunit